MCTLKNCWVAPDIREPYLISLCFARDSTSSIGEVILFVVRKAARFAVYELIIIKAKNHQTPVSILALGDFGLRSIPV